MPFARPLILSAAFCLLALPATGADAPGEAGAWRLVEGVPGAAVAAVKAPWVRPAKFQGYHLDGERWLERLEGLPHERNAAAAVGNVVSLPMPDGTFARFEVYESPVMAPALAAKYPQIRTYAGRGVDDPAATVRFDWTAQGFHAQILGPRGAAYVDPYWQGDRTFYASYWKRDYGQRGGFSCDVDRPFQHLNAAVASAVAADSDGLLRTYRLACAATGEYTGFHGGTVADGLSAIVTAINRVTGLYENEVGVRLELIANNDQIVYTNGATDPYSNNDGFAMLSQNQSNINATIGSANYDIGHVFSTGGGGVASLGVVCVNSFKARGVTGLPSPIGDPFYVDYVAHEMGHQFGANHTFNGVSSSCCCGNRNGSTAYEPGSGATIMAYAGICGLDNLQSNSDPMFHSVSLDEMTQFITAGSGSFCPSVSATGNTLPTVSAGPDYTIPAQTPFELTAEGDDADGDPVTYSWEQRDLGPGVTLFAPDNGTSPLVRTWDPVEDPSRIIPRLSNLLNNTLPTGEKLPVVDRSMDFRVIARDNRPGGGAFSTDNMVVTVVETAGPFLVTRPNTALSLSGLQSITWDPAGTDASPINASTVDILLSTDGGLTYPIALAEATPNDGEELLVLPDVNTTAARVRIQGTGNIFFDISDENFTIESCTAPAAPVAIAGDPDKNRFASLVPGNAGAGAALRVILADLPPPFEGMEGEVRWVGPPQEYTDITSTFWAAPLQCDPYFQDWGDIDALHLFGPEIVPEAAYDVQIVHCDLEDEGRYSSPLTMFTAVWGDVAPPYDGDGGAPQPDVLDVAGMVDRVKALATAGPRVRMALHPTTVVPGDNANVLDIGFTVDALVGLPYPFSIPALCGP